MKVFQLPWELHVADEGGDEIKLDRTEMSTIVWMCGFKEEKCRGLLRLEPVNFVIKNHRLRWFGYVECLVQLPGIPYLTLVSLALTPTDLNIF